MAQYGKTRYDNRRGGWSGSRRGRRFHFVSSRSRHKRYCWNAQMGRFQACTHPDETSGAEPEVPSGAGRLAPVPRRASVRVPVRQRPRRKATTARRPYKATYYGTRRYRYLRGYRTGGLRGAGGNTYFGQTPVGGGYIR